jgi:fibrillarin-like pre-rRNA processing protein
VIVEPVEGAEGVYRIVYDEGNNKLATRNLCTGQPVYGEAIEVIEGVEYRVWDPYRSKLAAYILKESKKIPLKDGERILYLGAGTGTTASHISDIVGEKGAVYCVEFSQRVLRELVERLCRSRVNIYPLLADARLPDRYPGFVKTVDGIYCDVAQPYQAKIMGDNSEIYLKKGGWGLIAVKARSIDTTSDPEVVFKNEVETLKKKGFKIIDTRRLEPFEKDHLMVHFRFN